MAVHADRLTASGLLYEGNHAEWRPHIETVLRAHGYAILEENASSPFELLGHENCLPAVQIVSVHVSPALRARVPSADRRDAARLLAQLERFAAPFRFLDLPAELRVRIYDLHCSSLGGDHSISGPAEYRAPLPSLLQVCRIVRMESIPVFWNQTTVSIQDPCRVEAPEHGKVERTINELLDWTVAMSREHLKHIKHTRLMWKGASTYKFIWVIEKGGSELAIYCHGLTAPEEAAWKHHLAIVEKHSGWLGLQGEVLILVFTTAEVLLKQLAAA
ncbi:hypothetical protein LTR86_010628 [Recurvomyces mirabilis]|nr:hypothetical protein LTR86_010628 [Recurvomyces mirabilis]